MCLIHSQPTNGGQPSPATGYSSSPTHSQASSAPRFRRFPPTHARLSPESLQSLLLPVIAFVHPATIQFWKADGPSLWAACSLYETPSRRVKATVRGGPDLATSRGSRHGASRPEFRRVTPEPFKAVEVAIGAAEDMADNPAEVEENPLRVLPALTMEEAEPGFGQGLVDVIGDSLNLARGVAAGDEKVVGDDGQTLEFEQKDILGLAFLSRSRGQKSQIQANLQRPITTFPSRPGARQRN